MRAVPRILVLVAIALAGGAFAATPGHAAAPSHAVIASESISRTTAPCGFLIQESIESELRVTEWPGRFAFQGTVGIALSAGDRRVNRLLRVSFTTVGDLVTWHGQGYGTTPGHFWLVTGRLVTHLDGRVVSAQGRRVDACALLAGVVR